jgi:hypothetical protein
MTFKDFHPLPCPLGIPRQTTYIVAPTPKSPKANAILAITYRYSLYFIPGKSGNTSMAITDIISDASVRYTVHSISFFSLILPLVVLKSGANARNIKIPATIVALACHRALSSATAITVLHSSWMTISLV